MHAGLTLFFKCISKCLLNGKAPQHEMDIFTHVKGILYKHIMDSGKQFLALIILKLMEDIQSWWKLITNYAIKETPAPTA